MRLLVDNGRFLRSLARGQTDGTADADGVEQLAEGRYRALADRHGTYVVELPSRGAALEAVHVLAAVQDALVDAIAWGSWPDGRRSRPRTAGERYFRDVAAESRREAKLLAAEVGPGLRESGRWSDGEGRSVAAATVDTPTGPREALRVEVAYQSLVLTTHAASVDRAVAFVLLYSALQRDLRRVLGWEPLETTEAT